jgi:hypothetical protein
MLENIEIIIIIIFILFFYNTDLRTFSTLGHLILFISITYMHENNYEFSLASLKELMARDYYSKSLKTMGLCKLVGGTFFF